MSLYVSAISACSERFVQPPRHVVDVLYSMRPLSNKLACMYDESYVVCISDWIYIYDRKSPVLKPVDSWHELFFVLRNYTNFVITNINDRARLFVKDILSREHMPFSVYYRRSTIVYNNSKYDAVLITSDNPCLVYLIRDGSIVTSVDVHLCQNCHDLHALVIEAVNKFKKELNK